MRYSDVGKYGRNRLRRAKLKKIGYAVSCVLIGCLSALFIIYGIPYLFV